jgi:hypothetical protein
LLPELGRRRTALEHDHRFVRTVLLSDFEETRYVWRLDCYSRTGKPDWSHLSLQVAMIFSGPEVALQGQIDWHFPRAYGALPRPGHEYSTPTIHGSLDDSIAKFIRALPPLFGAFDEAVKRGSPRPLPNTTLEPTATIS